MLRDIRIKSYIIIIGLAVALLSFSSVFAQGKMFLQKKPDFNVDLQQSGQLPDNALSQASGAMHALRENCIAAIEKHTWLAHIMLEDIGTLLGAPPAGVPYEVEAITLGRQELERYMNATDYPQACTNCSPQDSWDDQTCFDCLGLQLWAGVARSPINGRQALSLFRQQARVFQQMGNMMREHQPQVVASDEKLNQKLFELTGQELANQFIEDSQGSCGLTPENSPWVGDPQR